MGGCTLHGGTGSQGMQFFPKASGDCGSYNFHCLCEMPKPKYEVFNSGTCESHGGKSIMTEAGCLEAGREHANDPSKGFRFDQPAGGYTSTGTSRAKGCTLHGGTGSQGMQFFPKASGDCGSYNF